MVNIGASRFAVESFQTADASGATLQVSATTRRGLAISRCVGLQEIKRASTAALPRRCLDVARSYKSNRPGFFSIAGIGLLLRRNARARLQRVG
jgi:hypothetical protein